MKRHVLCLNPLVIREELQRLPWLARLTPKCLNPLVIREELQHTSSLSKTNNPSLNPLVIREELQQYYLEGIQKVSVLIP